MLKETGWYFLIGILMSYPEAELTRYILACLDVKLMSFQVAAIEIGSMWLAYLIGLTILSWRLFRRVYENT